MKRALFICLFFGMILCSACGKQTEQAQLTRVVYARGHGSTWGNQFHMEVCPETVSNLHYFRTAEEGPEYRELCDIPIDKNQWEQIETAALTLLPKLEVQKPPGLLQRLTQALGPKTVDGGEWHKLTGTWFKNGELETVEYVWTATPEAEAFTLLLEELAQSLDQEGR